MYYKTTPFHLIVDFLRVFFHSYWYRFYFYKGIKTVFGIIAYIAGMYIYH